MNVLFNLVLVVGLVIFLIVWAYLPWPAVLLLIVVFALWMAFTRRGRQAASVTAVGISTLRQRLGSSSVVIIGIAGVVGVLVALLAMGDVTRRPCARPAAPTLRLLCEAVPPAKSCRCWSTTA